MFDGDWKDLESGHINWKTGESLHLPRPCDEKWDVEIAVSFLAVVESLWGALERNQNEVEIAALEKRDMCLIEIPVSPAATE